MTPMAWPPEPTGGKRMLLAYHRSIDKRLSCVLLNDAASDGEFKCSCIFLVCLAALAAATSARFRRLCNFVSHIPGTFGA